MADSLQIWWTGQSWFAMSRCVVTFTMARLEPGLWLLLTPFLTVLFYSGLFCDILSMFLRRKHLGAYFNVMAALHFHLYLMWIWWVYSFCPDLFCGLPDWADTSRNQEARWCWCKYCLCLFSNLITTQILSITKCPLVQHNTVEDSGDWHTLLTLSAPVHRHSLYRTGGKCFHLMFVATNMKIWASV